MKTAVVVDGYSTGRFLPHEFAKLGLATLHVQSTRDLLAYGKRTFVPENFVANVVHEGDAAQTARAIARSCDVGFVVAGSEPGVTLADELAHLLATPANNLALSAARRDKYLMSEALRSNGVRAVRQIVTASAQAAVDWSKDEALGEVVVKPLDSASSGNVYFCSSDVAISRAIAVVLNARNQFDKHNTAALVQERLDGEQYTVNTVSRNGEHFVFEVWTDKRREVDGASVVYDLEELLPGDAPVCRQLGDYASQVLTALEIANGPAHLEIMNTAEGPVLIEMGARPQGSMSPPAANEALGYNHISLTALCYADPQAFVDFARRTVPYERARHALCISLISDTKATIAGYGPGLETIRQLATYFDTVNLAAIGDLLKPTVDNSTCPAIVYLVGDDERAVMEDYRALRRLRMDEIFQLDGIASRSQLE